MMQEKVVYILGAGFSAPLGLPVMSNFISKARILYNEDRERYNHFLEVLKMAEIAIAKNYFETDLGNIEEILSILDMRAQLEGNPRLSESARRCIKDVISHYTPEIAPYENSLLGISNWGEFIFGADRGRWLHHGLFMASLHNLTIKEHIDRLTGRSLRWDRVPNPETRYDVISLNYDCVLENFCTHLSNQCVGKYLLRFVRECTSAAAEPDVPWLVKLHGSTDRPEDIIAPTWSKTLTQKSVQEQWKAAHRLLVKANHIRVLGYSLPISDTYVKYLFKSSFIQAEHELRPGLKSFDVITLDDDEGTTRKRYKDFVPSCRFVNTEIKSYLAFIEKVLHRQLIGTRDGIQFTKLEVAHQAFMDRLGKVL